MGELLPAAGDLVAGDVALHQEQRHATPIFRWSRMVV